MIITEVVNYVDSYGIEHAAPIFMARRIESNQRHYENRNLNLATGEYESDESFGQEIHFEICYWPSLIAKNNGRRPLVFISEDGRTNFTVSLAEKKEPEQAVREAFLQILESE